MVARRHAAAILAAALALIAVVVIVDLQFARENSATWDESLYLYLGASTDDRSFDALGVAPLPVRLTWTRRVLAPEDVAINDVTVYRERIDRARRNAIAWFAVPLVLVILVWVSLAHGVLAGTMAAALVALSPNVVAHGSLATTDIAFTLAFVVTIALQIAYLSCRSWPKAIAFGAALGVALATKYSAIALFLIALVTFAIRWRERRWRRDAVVLVGGVIVAGSENERSVNG